MKTIKTVGDLRLALEGIEDSTSILSCTQPAEKDQRNACTSVFGELAEIRGWNDLVIIYSEVLKGKQHGGT